MLSKSAQNRRQKAREYVTQRLALHQYDDLTEVLREMEQQLEWAPSRSTFYSWVQDWRAKRALDKSSRWSLATDATGRPDIVMAVLAALVGASDGRLDSLSVAQAQWVVRLDVALPGIRQDGVGRWGKDGERPAWGGISLWEWANNFVAAEAAGDTAQLAELEAKVAVIYANKGRHFAELLGGDEGRQEVVREIRATPDRED